MGTGTIPSATDGNKIPASHHNSVKSALAGNVVARNTAGNATDVAGSLGSSTYRWLAGFFRRLFIGTAVSSSDNVKIHRSASQTIQILPGDDTTNDGVDATTLGSLDSKDVNRSALPSVGNAGRRLFHTLWKALYFEDGSNWYRVIKDSYWKSAAGSVSPVPITGVWIDIPNTSLSITTNGLPLFFTVIEGALVANKGSAIGSATLNIRLVRDSTTVGSTGIQTDCVLVVPASCCSWHDIPSPGTYTYKLQVMANQTGIVVNAQSCKLFAKEL